MKIDIIAVGGDDSLRMFTLSRYEFSAVLRKGACLECCLNICQEAGYPVVVC